MLSEAFSLISQAFAAAVTFFEKIVSAVGAAPLIFSAVGLAFVVSLFLLPLRGQAIGSFSSSMMNHIRGKFQKNKQRSGKANGGK